MTIEPGSPALHPLYGPVLVLRVYRDSDTAVISVSDGLVEFTTAVDLSRLQELHSIRVHSIGAYFNIDPEPVPVPGVYRPDQTAQAHGAPVERVT